jgi:hypothetical protein
MFLDSQIALKELRRVAQSKEPHIPVSVLAEYVLNYCTRDSVPAPVRNDETRWLEALYRLEDPRRG